jgi:hypothetical protein
MQKTQHTTLRESPVKRLDRVKEKNKPESSGKLEGTVSGDMQVDEREDDEDEPYIPTPERNRMLRGIVKSQLLETDAFPDRSVPGGKKERGSIKIECDVSRLGQSRSTRFGSA